MTNYIPAAPGHIGLTLTLFRELPSRPILQACPIIGWAVRPGLPTRPVYHYEGPHIIELDRDNKLWSVTLHATEFPNGKVCSKDNIWFDDRAAWLAWGEDGIRDELIRELEGDAESEALWDSALVASA